ncbi:hypothetical protein [Nocardia sp. CA-290969]|uniref:hypothetical protein n=1 Tax=Nocardia sp. CA-290969 TaxID=3239986 RepID=UPI003D89FBB3
MKIQMPWRGHLWVSEERGEGGDGAVDAVGVAAGRRDPSVVDELSVPVAPRVCSDDESVADAERVFDPLLVNRVLDLGKPTWAFDPGVGRVVEPGSSIGKGDIVADLPEVLGGEMRIGTGRHQTEMHPYVVGSLILGVGCRPGIAILSITGVVVDAQVCVVGVVGEDHIDHEPVAGEKPGPGVEGAVYSIFRRPNDLANFVLPGVRACAQVYADSGDVKGFAVGEAMLRRCVGGAAVGVSRPVRGDSGASVAERGLGAVVLANSPDPLQLGGLPASRCRGCRVSVARVVRRRCWSGTRVCLVVVPGSGLMDVRVGS